jgi:hypothetical protein
MEVHSLSTKRGRAAYPHLTVQVVNLQIDIFAELLDVAVPVGLHLPHGIPEGNEVVTHGAVSCVLELGHFDAKLLHQGIVSFNLHAIAGKQSDTRSDHSWIDGSSQKGWGQALATKVQCFCSQPAVAWDR